MQWPHTRTQRKYKTLPNLKTLNLSPVYFILFYCISTHRVLYCHGFESTKWGEKSFKSLFIAGAHSYRQFRVPICFARMSLEGWNVPGTCRGPTQTHGEHASPTQRGPQARWSTFLQGGDSTALSCRPKIYAASKSCFHHTLTFL